MHSLPPSSLAKQKIRAGAKLGANSRVLRLCAIAFVISPGKVITQSNLFDCGRPRGRVGQVGDSSSTRRASFDALFEVAPEFLEVRFAKRREQGLARVMFLFALLTRHTTLVISTPAEDWSTLIVIPIT